MNINTWPDIPFNEWKDTLETVQLRTQIVGKIRLKSMPWLNHSWHVTLYVSSVGLTTGSMPYTSGIFEIEFNFIQHVLTIKTSTGIKEEIDLYPRTVADFYGEVFDKLKRVNIEVTIYAVPNELDPVIPFEKDNTHKTYNKEQVKKYWQALVQVNNVFTKFRAGFQGKCSPVHLF